MSDTTSGTGPRARGGATHAGSGDLRGAGGYAEVEHVEVAVYHIPTDGPEADGTWR